MRDLPSRPAADLRDHRVDGVHRIVPLSREPGRFAFHVGDTVELDGFRARIAEVAPEGATAVEFEFDVPCDDPSSRWVAWNGSRYVPFTPPPLGQQVEIPEG